MKKIKIARRLKPTGNLLKQMNRVKADFVKAYKDISKTFDRSARRDHPSWQKAAAVFAKKWGFVRKSTSGASDYVYISRKHKLVLKRSYLVGTKPVCAIPTMAIPCRWESCEDEGQGPVYVQPLADVGWKAAGKAYGAIYDSSLGGSDLHDGNVAIYNGQAVCIDW
jgi:hypothetical protein